MSKNKSKSRSGSSRSVSRSRSRSFSKSRSRSRSASHSRKRRHRGFYPRGQHNRGGYVNYRPNWQNYNRQQYSPRRGRSRSRSPKRRSVSPRSRSRSRNSDKSSSDRSRRSSSSRSSSNHSRVETKRKSKKEKKSHSKDQRSSVQADDDSKEQSASVADNDKTESSKTWQDMEAYDTSPVPQRSPDERAPTVKSSVQSVVVRRCSPRPSPGQKPSPPSPSVLQSGGNFRSSSRQSPFEHSLSPPRKSPMTKSPPTLGSLYGNQKEEGRSGELTAPIGTGYKRFMEEQKNKASELEKENGKEKMSNLEKIKDRGSPTDFAMSELERAYKKSISPKRYKMKEEMEKIKLAELRYAKEEHEQEKKGRARKDSDSDSKNQDPYDPAKWEELSFIPSAKEKRKKSEDTDDEIYMEKPKKEEKTLKSSHKGFLPEKNFRVTGFKASKERSESPPPRKSESKEKLLSKEDLSFSKSSFSVSRETGPNIRLDSFDEDLARPSGIMAHERKLSRDLVHSSKKDQEFKSIFQHIQSTQAPRSPSELFAQHIVTIVHYVREHHFGTSNVTLSERFSSYVKKTKEQEPSKTRKSPEIHRCLSLSFPACFLNQESLGEGKYREEPSDLRQDIERRKKHKDKRDHSRDSGDSRDSSRSRERSPEKPEKTRKSSKKHKKHRKVRERSRSSSSSSRSSHSMQAPLATEEFPTESEEKEESSARLGNKDFLGTSDRGRARGTFQYRARGTRPWGRGAFPGNNNNNNNDFQKRGNREEEWDPEYTPKSKKYYLHDDREGENEDKWVNRGRGRASFPRGRGRFVFRKPGTSPKWAHDKFSGEEGEIEEDESGAEKDEKGSLQMD
uniref:Thyroid hormone receptor-associated protein 3 n=1 Tax=Pyxicephalus adspersus TaxID=30357 RepID=A0AAV3B3R1_PYXAD|nr:TPA: hypothetical protein GDO54_001303 [Pyxicephalus adspersus]